MSKWWLLSGVTLLQLVVAVAVRLAPLRLVRAMAMRIGRALFAPIRRDDDCVVWAIGATGRRIGRISTCLVQAIVAEAILSSADRPLRLAIGVKRTSEGLLDAHAWVENGDRVLIGATADSYTQLVEWGNPPA